MFAFRSDWGWIKLLALIEALAKIMRDRKYLVVLMFQNISMRNQPSLKRG
jgi:hypothetical protein